MLNLNHYEQTQKTSILSWKVDIPEMIAKCAEILYLPSPPFLGEMLPYKEIEQALYLDKYAEQFALDKKDCLDNSPCSFQELRNKDLRICDSLAAHIQAWGQNLSVPDREKATLPVLMLDIPPIATAALRLIHKIGICYGYEIEQESDHKYILEGLYRIAGHPHIPSRSLFEDNSPVNLRRIAKHVGVDLTFRKFLVQYPYLRNAVGTSASRWYFKDAGLVAQRIFQKRWLIDSKKWR